MCPLRVILIFLSATLAGFLVVKNFKSQQNNNVESDIDEHNNNNNNNNTSSSKLPIISTSLKVRGAIETGFWTCIDMASGRYLWRNLVSSSSSTSSSKHST